MGMADPHALDVNLPLAWPVVLTGVRVSTQMCMGVAAVAAYVQGPGLGSYIFNGLARLGGAGAVESALVGTLGVVLLALALDGLLVLLRRATTSGGSVSDPVATAVKESDMAAATPHPTAHPTVSDPSTTL